jgi:hypothetical protein
VLTQEPAITVDPVEPPVSSFTLPPDETFVEEATPASADASATETASAAANPRKTSGKGFNIILLGIVGAGLLGIGGVAGLYFTRPRGPA